MSLVNLLGNVLRIKTFHIWQNFNSHTSYKCAFLKKWNILTNQNFLRRISHETSLHNQETFTPFLDMVNYRRAEASRSILVQVQSAQSFRELYSYCSAFGMINQMFHYVVGSDKLHFIIVEFDTESCVNDVLLNGAHLEDSQIVPVHSNCLWFKATGRKISLKQTKPFKLNMENGNEIIKENELKEELERCENISDQILTLHNRTMLNDVATRLRFLTAHQLELALSGLFPKAIAYPFGSSVNGFGKMGCDLDLVLRFKPEGMVNFKDWSVEETRLVFHCKSFGDNERSISQRHMEVMGDLLQLFLPGCTQIRKILQARVPIIKYYHQLTDVECDLSMSNMSGVHMSDLLYSYGAIDPRVRPLIFIIKKWAQSIGITNNSPGRWITNFSLTLLALGFLQKPINSPPILPTFNTLMKHAGPNDKYVTEDGVNCSFLRDVGKLDQKTENKEDLESLFKQFCELYSSFDYSSKAVCLNETFSVTKPDHSALYIINPLERGLNVSKNVSLEELEKFKYELRNALWCLELQEKRDSNNWGILDLLSGKKKTNSSSFAFSSKHARLMEVSGLFEDKQQSEHVLKNDKLVRKIEQIKSDTVRRLKHIENGSRIISKRKSRR